MYHMHRYQKEGPLRGTDAPVVGVLLYRKHVITEQPYIHQLINLMEEVRTRLRVWKNNSTCMSV